MDVWVDIGLKDKGLRELHGKYWKGLDMSYGVGGSK